jgi:DNA-directed RNA polymerase beta' subunit
MISHEDITARLSVRCRLDHVRLTSLDINSLRDNAPGIVSCMGTYDKDTLKPARGGLFDEESFGLGETLDFGPVADDVVVLHERARRFARILMPFRVAHPFVGMTSELPVLPPDLRPIARRDGEIVMSDLNCHYQDVVMHAQRLERLSQLKAAPPVIIDEECAGLQLAVERLLNNESHARPSCDGGGRVLASLRALLRPDATSALESLDQAVAAGTGLNAPLPMRLHRTVAALFAMSIVVRRRRDAAN